MCAALQQQFVRLSGWSTTILDCSSYLDGLPRLSAARAWLCERSITVAEIQEVMSISQRSPGLDGQLYEFHLFTPDLFGQPLADANHGVVCRGVVTLLKKDTDNEDVVGNFRHKGLLNTKSKILAKMLAKSSLVREVQATSRLIRTETNGLKDNGFLKVGQRWRMLTLLPLSFDA